VQFNRLPQVSPSRLLPKHRRLSLRDECRFRAGMRAETPSPASETLGNAGGIGGNFWMTFLNPSNRLRPGIQQLELPSLRNYEGRGKPVLV